VRGAGPRRGPPQQSGPWYALALRLEADRAERAAARRAAEEVAKARQRAAPIIIELDRLTAARTPQADYPLVANYLLLTQRSFPGWRDGLTRSGGALRPPPGSGSSISSRPPTRVSGKPGPC
jgi:hypothetical protein